MQDISLFDEEDLAITVRERKDDYKDPDLELRVHELFEKCANELPNSIAAEDLDGVVTFSELNQRANCIANALMQKGVGSQMVVALYLMPSTDMLASILAVHKLNATYLPIDTNIPKQRVKFLLRDSSARCMLVNQEDKLDFEIDTEILSLDSDLLGGPQPPKFEIKKSEVKDSDAAYIIYTSGTTGQPKGVVIGHSGLSNFIKVFKDQLIILESTGESIDSWLWSHSYSFDASIKGLIMLCLGRKVIFPPDLNMMIDSRALIEFVLDRGIKVLNGSPALIQGLLTELEEQQVAVNLIVSGEAVSDELWGLLLNYCSRFSVKAINAYGPTETTINSSFTEVCNGERVSIGRPVSGHQICILDENLNMLPSCAVGEICVSGPGLALAYLNNSKAYTRDFVANPYFIHGFGSDVLYRTGDIGRYRHDGKIEFIGRKDRQVKFRGFRMELEEIDAAINQIPGVTESYSMLIQVSDSKLVSFVEMVDQPKEAVKDIRVHLSNLLPAYMMPQEIFIHSNFAKTVGGKLDVSALRTSLSKGEPVLPDDSEISELEIQLIELWKDILKVEQLSVNDNFFEIGGHSLMAMKLVSEIRRRFSVQFQVRAMLVSPTITDLSKLIEESRSKDQSKEIITI